MVLLVLPIWKVKFPDHTPEGRRRKEDSLILPQFPTAFSRNTEFWSRDVSVVILLILIHGFYNYLHAFISYVIYPHTHQGTAEHICLLPHKHRSTLQLPLESFIYSRGLSSSPHCTQTMPEGHSHLSLWLVPWAMTQPLHTTWSSR